MNRFGLYVLPVLAVAFVAVALLVVGAARPILAARLYGGPTEGATAVAWRLLVAERRDETEAPVQVDQLQVEIRLADGRTGSWQGSTDHEGLAEVRVPFGDARVTGPVTVRVTAPGAEQHLASGRVLLAPQDWAAHATELGGTIDGLQSGALRVAVAPGRGVLAVPFTEPLLISVTERGEPVVGALLTFEPDGIDVRGQRGPQPVRTNALGRAVVEVTPREHVCALRVTAALPDGRRGQWYARLPVLQGALHATLQDDRLRITSPVPRERAYFALVQEHQRLAGGAVTLDADGRGGSVQLVSLPPLPPGEVWVVVSSEADLLSASAVGWPLVRGASLVERWDRLLTDGPLRSRSVPEQLLLDGFAKTAKRRAERSRRARLLSVGFVAIVLALLASLMVRRVGAAQAKLSAHLERSSDDAPGAERIAPGRQRNLWTLLVAVLCVALAFAMLALLLLYRTT